MKNKDKLTGLMQKALTDLLKVNEYRHNSNTINALIRRGLITARGTLTQEGREFAITFLSLGRELKVSGTFL